jgi:hypothetical protein
MIKRDREREKRSSDEKEKVRANEYNFQLY